MEPQEQVDAPAPVEAPIQRMDPRIVRVWRASAALAWVIWIGVAAGALLLLELSPAWALPLAAIAIAHVVLIPPRRYAHFAYQVGETDVRVMYGWVWRGVSVVLHSRIQHVDTRQGPIERAVGLASVVIFTAGTVGAMVGIPGLAAADAEALRDRLAHLSGTDDAV